MRTVCNLERPSELSWRARHGRKKKLLSNSHIWVGKTKGLFAFCVWKDASMGVTWSAPWLGDSSPDRGRESPCKGRGERSHRSRCSGGLGAGSSRSLGSGGRRGREFRERRLRRMRLLWAENQEPNRRD